MKKLSLLLMLVSLLTFSIGPANAQVKLKGLKDKAKSSLGVKETPKQEPAQQNEATVTNTDTPAPHKASELFMYRNPAAIKMMAQRNPQ